MKREKLKKYLIAAGTIPALLLTYIGFACILSLIPVNSSFQEAEDGIDIFVTSNGVHTDIVVPVTTEWMDWRKYVKPEQFRKPASEFRYLSIGWGDKGFYLNTPTWADLRFSTAFRALFWMSTSAVHTAYHENAPVPGKLVRKIKISAEQYRKLTEHLLTAFREDQEGNFIPLNCCYYSGLNDNFYDGKGTYNLFYTCNTWTGDGLKAAGIPTALWAPFEWSVMSHLK